METTSINLSSVILDKETHTLRIPPRKEEDQQFNYKELFDYTTLFADIFFLADGRVELLGPPLLNLESILKKGNLSIDGKNYHDELNITSEHRKCRILLPKIQNIHKKKLVLEYEGTCFEREIQPNQCDFFKDCNVLVTQQRDNPLEWIGYWIAHHAKHHETDAVLIYDNGSTLYTLKELEKLVCSVKGIKKVCIVNWLIPYGVTGGDKSIWDSDFGQYQSWEHAMARFCANANTVIIGDVDELIVHEQGISIPQLLAYIDEPVVAYRRRQIEEVLSLPKYTDLPRMHCHTHLYQAQKMPWAAKYAINPKKVKAGTHFRVHDVLGDKMYTDEKLLGRHFGALRIHWRVGSFEPIPMKTKEEYKTELTEDIPLKQSFQDVDLSWLSFFRQS